MKILWHSNAAWTQTGYGNQTALFLPRLQALGHEMVAVCNYGLQGRPQTAGGITFLPGDDSGNGAHNDTLAADAKYVGADIVISLYDTLVFEHRSTRQFRWVAWLPVDHDPVPTVIVNALATCWRPIAYSRWGHRKLQEAGLRALYVPHGTDTRLYRPPDDKTAARKDIGCPQDVFVVGIVAANKGGWDRKNFDIQIRAFAEFNRRHPDTMLYLHTEWDPPKGGQDIGHIIALAGIPSRAIGQPDQYKMARGLFEDKFMARAYGAMDVLLNCSMGEGFGLPILEAQACGTPVIVTDFSAMTELNFSGWAIPVTEDDRELTWQKSYAMRPRLGLIVEALEQAYAERGEKLRERGQRAHEKAQEYDADRVAMEYWKPALDYMAERVKAEKAMAEPVEVKP